MAPSRQQFHARSSIARHKNSAGKTALFSPFIVIEKDFRGHHVFDLRFSEQAFDEALDAYVEEATTAYPDSAALIHIVKDAMQDFMRSEHAAKFVAGSSAAEAENFGAPMPSPAEPPGGRPLTHPAVEKTDVTSEVRPPGSKLSWNDMD